MSVHCSTNTIFSSRCIKEKPKDEIEISKIDAAPLSKELKKRWSYFIRKVYEADPLTCPKCQGDLSAVAQAGQPEVIKKILPVCVRTRTGRQHLGLWEEAHAPPGKDPPVKEITFRGEPQGRTFDAS